MYISEDCNWTPYGTDFKLDKLVNSDNCDDRREAAKRCYGLDKLINDKHWGVRREVATQGYGLDILINDEDGSVRWVIACQGYGLDKLINDKDHWIVREAVAQQGYGLDKLINDEFWGVREAVKEYLEDHNLTLNKWLEQNPDKRYHESFRNIINDGINLDNCDEFVNQLVKDNMYLDWIIINITDSSLIDLVTQKLKELGCSDIQAWKEEYSTNVYYRNR